MDQLPILLEDYLNYLKTVRGLAPTTIQEYTYDLTSFFRFLRRRKEGRTYRKMAFDQIPIEDMDLEAVEKVDLHDLQAF